MKRKQLLSGDRCFTGNRYQGPDKTAFLPRMVQTVYCPRWGETLRGQSILTLFMFLMAVGTLAQDKPLSLKISVYNESTAIPFTRVFTSPLHIGVQAGIEVPYKTGKHAARYQSVNIGYYFHQHVTQAVYLNTGFGYDYRLSDAWHTKTIFSVGYLRSFSVQDQYALQDGQYLKGRDRGNSRLVASLSLGFGYRVASKQSATPEVYVLYEPWMEYPYSPGFIPLMTHVNFHVGSRFPLGRRK